MLKVISLAGAVWIVSWSVGSVEARWSGDYVKSSVQELRFIEVKDGPRCWRRRWIGTWHCKHRRHHTGRS